MPKRPGSQTSPPTTFVIACERGECDAQTPSNGLGMNLFTKHERDYINSLPTSARNKIRRTLESSKDVEEPLRVSLLRSRLPQAYKMNLFKMLTCEPSDKNEALVRSALRVPYGNYCAPPVEKDAGIFLRDAEINMDEHITGHEHAKREVLSILAQWHGGGRSPFAISFEGPPGTGKTTFVKHALAAVIGRPMQEVCLGGASDASFLIGHGFTYEGARPGRLVETLMESKKMDPVIFFDELDKVSDTPRGDELFNVLIHLTDPVMNSKIRDRYFLGLDLDFSRAILVFSFNDARRVNPILLDRIRRIKLDPPTVTQKRTIIQRQLLPRLRLSSTCDMEIEESALAALEDFHKSDVGMRGVERSLHELLSLALLCKRYGSCKIVGMSDVPLEHVSGKFAKHILTARDRASTSAPPCNMYT